MNEQQFIQQTANYIEKLLTGESTGHDWWHIYRVWQTTKHIAKEENANTLVVELAALLHDIADWKFHNGDDSVGPAKAREYMQSIGVENHIIEHVCQIISEISFKGSGVSDKPSTLECKIVQDADRLDAMGAIGIARTFAYGGAKGRELYNPNINPQNHASFEEYKKNNSPTINHFYEKLFLLKDRMHTNSAKNIAAERHAYMEQFVERFKKEWDSRI